MASSVPVRKIIETREERGEKSGRQILGGGSLYELPLVIVVNDRMIGERLGDVDVKIAKDLVEDHTRAVGEIGRDLTLAVDFVEEANQLL